ncbi:hypothetical protein [Aeromonas sobria]|nr:hypothetical protein [Aeromonas sobria]
MTGTSPEDQAKISALYREAKLLGEFPERLKAHSSARNELNLKSPSIPRRVFVAARKGIEEGEATHKVDREK